MRSGYTDEEFEKILIFIMKNRGPRVEEVDEKFWNEIDNIILVLLI